MVERVRNRLPVATSRKQTRLRVGWPSAFTGVFSLTLPRLVARVGLVDHVDFAAAAHHLAVGVALLGRFDRGNDFHKRDQSREGVPGCQEHPGDGSVLI
jgi:hypothetical protein